MEEITVESIEKTDHTELIDRMMTLYGQQILELTYSYVKNIQIAEDLTQEIFLKCYNSLSSFKGKSKLRTWLWQIAINHCKDYLKSWYNNNVITTDQAIETSTATSGTVEETVIKHSEQQQTTEIVLSLPVKYREVIYLFYYEELTVKEIATLIKVSQNTIKTRLKRAKELIKKEWEERMYGK